MDFSDEKNTTKLDVIPRPLLVFLNFEHDIFTLVVPAKMAVLAKIVEWLSKQKALENILKYLKKSLLIY